MTDNRTTELLPCPWCGEYPKLAEDGGSTGPWFCVWHDCPPVEGGKARHYGESLGCISITTAWFHTEAEAISAWNTRAELGSGTCEFVSSKGADYTPVCSACGYKLGIYDCEWFEDGTYGYSGNYCPNCGKAVKR